MAIINDTDLSLDEIEELLENLPVSQGSPEWFRQRLGRVTASRVKCVVARNRYGNPYKEYEKYMNELIAERITDQSKRFTSKPIEWGKNFEGEAAEYYEELTGNTVYEVPFTKVENMEAGASSDRLVNEDGNLEIKCPNSDTFVKYVLDNKVPYEYFDQVMWQMFVNDKAWTDFVAYDPDVKDPYPKMFIYRQKRDDEYIADMVAKVREFLAEVDRRVEKILNYQVYQEEQK